MAMKSKIKKGILMVLLVSVSFVLSAIGLFSGQGSNKTNQAQAACWTPPSQSGGCGCGCQTCGCFSCGCHSGGCGCCMSGPGT